MYHQEKPLFKGGGAGELSVPGCPINLDNTRTRPTLLAVGADGSCFDIFPLVHHFSFLSPSLWKMV